MKTDVTSLHYLIKISHLIEYNFHNKIWCSDNIDCNFKHVMHKCLDSYPQPLHGSEIRGSPTCSFEIFVAFDMKFGIPFMDHKDSYSFHILHQLNLKDLKKANCNVPIGCTVCVTVRSHMCTKGFLNYFSTIIEFLKVVFKGEIIKFSKNCCIFTIKESGGVKVQIMEFQNYNNNNKLP